MSTDETYAWEFVNKSFSNATLQEESTHVRESKTLDSPGFWFPSREIRIPGTRFRVLCQQNLDLDSNR